MLHREAVEAFLVLVLACLSASTIRRLLRGVPSDSPRSATEPRSGSPYALYFYTGLGLLIGFGFVVIPVSSALIRLFVALGLPFLTVIGLDEVTTKVLIVAALLVMVLRGEHRPLRSIGIVKPDLSDFVWGFVFFAIGEAGIYLMKSLLPPSFSVSAENGHAMLARFPLWLMLMIALVNGIFEEITARGFAVERLGEMTHSTVVGGAIALAINVAAHIPYWGWRASIILIPGLAAFVVLYLWRRSVVPCAIGHILNDAYPALLVAIVPLLPTSLTAYLSYDRQGAIYYKKSESIVQSNSTVVQSSAILATPMPINGAASATSTGRTIPRPSPI